MCSRYFSLACGWLHVEIGWFRLLGVVFSLSLFAARLFLRDLAGGFCLAPLLLCYSWGVLMSLFVFLWVFTFVKCARFVLGSCCV